MRAGAIIATNKTSIGPMVRVWRERRGLSQYDLSGRVGIKQSSLANIEKPSGQRKEVKNPKKLVEIIKALDIPPDEVRKYMGDSADMILAQVNAVAGQLEGAKDFPVYYSRPASGGGMMVDVGVREYIARPTVLQQVADSYGVQVSGSTMEPKYEPGDTIWIHPYIVAASGTDILLRRADSDAHALIRRLVNETETEWTVQQFNPAKTYSLKKSDWPRCDRIVGLYTRR